MLEALAGTGLAVAAGLNAYIPLLVPGLAGRFLDVITGLPTLRLFGRAEAQVERVRVVTDRYRTYCSDPSFVDYFWTVRIMHQPLWQLARVAHAWAARRWAAPRSA